MHFKIIVVLTIAVGNGLCSESFVNNALSTMSERFNSTKMTDYTSAMCFIQLGVYIEKMVNSPFYDNNWAWQMFDSSSKIPDGLLTGNFRDFGNFDECVDIDTFDKVEMKGKFCMSALIIPLSIIRDNNEDPIGALSKANFSRVATSELLVYLPSICIPHRCTPKDIVTAIELPHEMAIDLFCTTKDDIGNYDGADWSFIVFIVIIGICVVASTAYDMYLQEHKIEAISEAAVAFSLYTNGRKLFQVSNNSAQISCLNGIRVFSTMWVIIHHRNIMNNVLPMRNLYDSQEWFNKLYTQYMQAAPLAVDSFIFMSGVVMSYGFIRTQSKPGAHFNVFMFYLHRYLRLTPALAVIYFLQVSWVRHVSSGPQWEFVMNYTRDLCTDNGWAYFFYLQNYAIEAKDMCLGHTWYLSLDMHIYIFSPLLLVPMVKYPKYMKYILPGLLFLSIIPPITLLYYYDAPMGSNNYFNKYYYQTHPRLSPWFVGVMLGYYFVKSKNTKLKISRIANILIWAFVLIGMMTIIYFTHYYTYTIDAYNRTGSAIFVGVHRMFWAVGLCWIVLACHKGYGGIVNWLLSLPFFEVVGKLSYSMYLIHITIILISILRLKTAIVWNDYDLIYSSIGDIIVIAFLAIFFTLLFESPALILEKVAFGPGKKAQPKLKNLPDTA